MLSVVYAKCCLCDIQHNDTLHNGSVVKLSFVTYAEGHV
jgi:hypothetical protein